ncbi:TIGR04141 family sporadically distributed protein [Salinicoccus kekensis]|uniref:Uncharacterized protein (TIGR04141 family) n=1 Tax=Salinicoccus kekensis TaxID=714307 RepID=A0A285UAG8_9STAP|nr:TIGR04141 family sporadically distributed protein [Salinicoccus kekensis]SOC37556.1 uncharacterized protein (TIGR04141 family) [Salinicoccus kekensis]
MKELVIFKIKSTYSYDDVIESQEAFKNLGSENDTYDVNSLDEKGKVYIGHNNQNEPGWYDNVKMLATALDKDIKNQSSRAIAVLEVDNKVYILTFGHGRHMINEDYIVRNFGRKIVLNLIEADSIKTTQTAAIGDFITSHLSSSSRQTNLNDLRINTDSDLLLRIEGNINILNLKANAVGGDSIKLSFKEPIEVTLIVNIIRELEKQYNEDAYKEKFEWIDNLVPIKDKVLKDEIFKAAFKDFIKEDASLHLVNLDTTYDNYSYSFTEKGSRVEDINDLKSLITVGERIEEEEYINELTQSLLKKKIFAHDNENGDILLWSLKKCLAGEVPGFDRTYTLFLGNIYEVNQDYVNTINEKVKSLQNDHNFELDFDICDKKEEGDYLQEQAENRDDIMCLDQDFITYNGRSIEACDLLTDNKELIHVKKWSSSSTLSHLFQQGIVSAELLLNDRYFREELNKKLNEEKFKIPETNFQPPDYTIIYSVLFKAENYTFVDLPIFSKIVLVNSFITLRNLAFKVKLNSLRYIVEDKQKSEE